MRQNNKKITRQRLEELVWLQCSHIEQLTETVQLLRKQNTLLHIGIQKIKEDAGLLPKVRPYRNTYGKKDKQKTDNGTCATTSEG